MQGFWKRLGDKILSVKWGSIVIEDGHLSLGRVLTWLVFGLVMYLWISGQSVPGSTLDVLFVLFAYNFGKKITGPIQKFLAGRKADAEAGEADGAAVKSEKVTVVEKPFED